MYANHKTRGRRGRQKMECETRENRRYRGISRERCGKDGAYVGRSIAATAEFLGGKPFFMGSARDRGQTGGALEKAYQRGELLARRRELMDQWCRYCPAQA